MVLSSHIRKHATQGAKFGLAGLCGTLVDITGFNLILFFTHIDARWAGFFSAPFALLTVFLLNKHMTFRVRQGRTKRQAVRFACVYGVAIALNLGLTALGITFGMRMFPAVSPTLVANASKLIAIALVSVWNYSLLHFFVFTHEES